MADFGYDVADYCDVDPVFGSLATLDRLVREAHDRGLRVVLDWVPNHTSSLHPWFVASRADRTNPLRDWYIWRDGAPGRWPNNWIRAFAEEPAWTYDPVTDQSYLHSFLPAQPDLNWANPDVRTAMAATLRFWLDRGIDGFRMDVIHAIGKDPALPDDPPERRAIGHFFYNDEPETHEYVAEIRAVLESYGGDRVSIGEVSYLEPERIAAFCGGDRELHLAFTFAGLYTPWRAGAWAELINRTDRAHGDADAWPTWVLSNHDTPRVATRLKGDLARVRAALLLLLTLRGTPFLYAGEELGMADGEIPPSRVVDPGGRDGCRTPIPWDDSPNFGWPADPWLPFAAGSAELAAARQAAVGTSTLNFTRTLLAWRRSVAALRSGGLSDVVAAEDVLGLRRTHPEGDALVRINFSREDRAVEVGERWRVALSSGDAAVSDGTLRLGPSAAVILLRGESPERAQ